MQTLQIDQQNARKLFPTASSAFKQMLIDTFGENFFTGKITDRVKTFDDILAISGRTMESLINPGDTADEIAYKKIKLIAEVYNEGTILDPMNTSQYKYYPWHEIKPGFGLSFDVCDYWNSRSHVGVRLCFKNAELAKDAGIKFIDIYTDLKIK